MSMRYLNSILFDKNCQRKFSSIIIDNLTKSVINIYRQTFHR